MSSRFASTWSPMSMNSSRRGPGSRAYLRQQVHGEVHGQGRFPYASPHPSFPRRPHQQNVVCAGADRLQTGMRGAFGKPQGLVARVNIGQTVMSVRCKDQHKAHVIEALRRSKFKFPGRQKLIVSGKWGFTRWPREVYDDMRKSLHLTTDGVGVQYHPDHGPLKAWMDRYKKFN